MTRHRRMLAVVGAALLIFAACSNDDGEDAVDVDVLPIESIIAGDISIVSDPSGTAARLEVDTSIPVACSVIYGTDDSFGSIAVDNDMQGGAHSDHMPLMSGLMPATEYSYILQGSDAEGRIYRSEVMTFTTPAAAENPNGTNLARTGMVLAVSSEFSDDFAAANAIDGDLATEWSTDGDGDDAFIEIDLGQESTITAVALRTRQMGDGSAITEEFTVTVGGTTLGPFVTGTEAATFDEPVTGQVVRIDADRTTGGNTGAVEIEIFGTT